MNAYTSEVYKSEVAFLNRKLPTKKIKWEARERMGQLVTPSLPESEANGLLKEYKDVLGAKAGNTFSKMFMLMPSKLQGGVRMVISIEALRDIFASEIDGAGGGGGRGYNPLSTRPGRGSGGV